MKVSEGKKFPCFRHKELTSCGYATNRRKIKKKVLKKATKKPFGEKKKHQ
jgi:hypothetical protein